MKQSESPTKRWRMPNGQGILCPFCKSPDIKVYYGRDGVAEYRRVRTCRDCGKQFQTAEKVIGYQDGKK